VKNVFLQAHARFDSSEIESTRHNLKHSNYEEHPRQQRTFCLLLCIQNYTGLESDAINFGQTMHRQLVICPEFVAHSRFMRSRRLTKAISATWYHA
jgi:hypothetical protein